MEKSLEHERKLYFNALMIIREQVEIQAEDEALWCEADSIIEAYVQQELRKLHEVIESELRACGLSTENQILVM